MTRKIVSVVLLAVLLTTIVTAAFADSAIYDCPVCGTKTIWRECCSGNSAGNSSYGSHVNSQNKVCNTYYMYKYNGRKCVDCGNIYTYSGKHIHTWKHSICVDQNWCPF